MKALMMITLAAVMTISAKGQDTISTKYLDMVMDGSVLTITPRKNLSSETGVRKVPYAETRLGILPNVVDEDTCGWLNYATILGSPSVYTMPSSTLAM
ncbi:MAG: hypothetical protein J5I53_07720 [Bradyrhizobiaceae bacterium]|nr:hypothetical protein [Bradyrhizobiaceae bacterium]